MTPTAETNRLCGSWATSGTLSHPGYAGQEGCPCSPADKTRWRTSCSGWTENQQTPRASLRDAPRSAQWRPPDHSADPRGGLRASPAPVWRRSGREEIRTGRQGESPASVPTAELRRRAGNSLRSGPLEAGRSGLWRPIPSGHTSLSAFRRIFFVATLLNICRLDLSLKSRRKDLEEVPAGCTFICFWDEKRVWRTAWESLSRSNFICLGLSALKTTPPSPEEESELRVVKKVTSSVPYSSFTWTALSVLLWVMSGCVCMNMSVWVGESGCVFAV